MVVIIVYLYRLSTIKTVICGTFQKIQKSLIEAFGDEMFIFPMHKLAIDYSQSGSAVYFYYFTYAPEYVLVLSLNLMMNVL